MKFIRRICLLTAILFSLFTRSSAQDASLEQDVEACLGRHGAIGVACSVVKDGKIVLSGEFGSRDTEGTGFSGKHDDIFRIASISKSFVATAIMKLAEEGKLSLDDDAQKHLPFPLRHPDYPDKVISVKMLLNHTSSIAHSKYHSLDIINPEKNPSWKECFKEWKPGTKYKYSNLGFNLLAAIIESASGERFDIYIKKNICEPLGMNASFNPEDLDAGLFVPLYRWNAKKGVFTNTSGKAYKPCGKPWSEYVPGYDAALFSGAGGMKTSATDLAKYMIMHMNFGEYCGVRIISEESSRLMQHYTVPTGNRGALYGLGLRSRANWVDGKTVEGHTGGAHGLHSIMSYNREGGWGFVSIVNGCRDDNGLLKELDNILYKHFIE